MKISDILLKYDTDKQSHHRYGYVYDFLFQRFDQHAELDIFEIGAQKGGSLLAWKEYFPNANVLGIDVVDVVPEAYKKDTVTRVIGDIKDFKTDKKFDIIIDDGSHYLADMAFVISKYCQQLKPNGILVIEDIRHPDLMFKVIENLMAEIVMGFPDYVARDSFEVKSFDNRAKGAESSFLIAMIKK